MYAVYPKKKIRNPWFPFNLLQTGNVLICFLSRNYQMKFQIRKCNTF